MAKVNDQKNKHQRPQLNAGDQDLARITSEAWSAIENANQPPYLFRFGDLPCRLEHNDRKVLTVRQLDPVRLRYEVARVAGWFRWDNGKEKPAKPPMDVASRTHDSSGNSARLSGSMALRMMEASSSNVRTA